MSRNWRQNMQLFGKKIKIFNILLKCLQFSTQKIPTNSSLILDCYGGLEGINLPHHHKIFCYIIVRKRDRSDAILYGNSSGTLIMRYYYRSLYQSRVIYFMAPVSGLRSSLLHSVGIYLVFIILQMDWLFTRFCGIMIIRVGSIFADFIDYDFM